MVGFMIIIVIVMMILIFVIIIKLRATIIRGGRWRRKIVNSISVSYLSIDINFVVDRLGQFRRLIGMRPVMGWRIKIMRRSIPGRMRLVKKLLRPPVEASTGGGRLSRVKI